MATKRAARMRRQGLDAPLLQVGASKDAVIEARAAILAILAAHADQETLRAALQALTGLCAVTGANIMNCSFNAGKD